MKRMMRVAISISTKRAGRRLDIRDCEIRWQMRAMVGTSIIITLKSKGTIDDLATCVHILPIRKNERTLSPPSHQSYYLGFYHINYNNHNQPMDLLQHKSTEVSPPYLLELSKQVDVLSKLAIIQRQGPLTQQFSQVLHDQFSELSQYLALYNEDAIMKECSMLKCKIALSFFVWDKALGVVPKQHSELKSAFCYLIEQFHSYTIALENLIHQERSSKSAFIDGEKDKIIANLRRELTVKREHMQDLEQRVKEIQDQNSKLYSKLITNAKQKVDYFSKTSTNQYKSTSTDKGSPRKKNTGRSIRSMEDQIIEVIQSKRKHESINERRSSLSQYLSTYFTLKYGKPLAEQNQADFRQTVCFLARSQEKHIFVLFQSILEEECDQAYIIEQRIFLEKVNKCVKRYINQKYGRTMSELDRFFDVRANEEKSDLGLTQDDVEAILTNIYKYREVHTLQRIICEVVTSQEQKQTDRVSCRKFINQLLDYQYRVHMTRIDDIVREIQRLPEKGSSISFEQFQRIIIKTVSDPEKRQLILRQLQRQRPWTSSQVIEIIQKVRYGRRRD